MQEEGLDDTPFWNTGEREKPDFQGKIETNRYGSATPMLSYEKYIEKQAILNKEWKDKGPDDMIMMRDDIVGAKIVYIGCAVLYLLMTGLDGDASPISPLREQIWPLVIIALLSPLHFLISRQNREVRWHAKEMTAVIYRKGIFGASSCFVVSATKLERGDELILKSDTHTWTDDDGTHKSSTSYWIEIHRNGQHRETFASNWNNQNHLLATIDFLRHKISQ